jgi:hypothetical protein
MHRLSLIIFFVAVVIPATASASLTFTREVLDQTHVAIVVSGTFDPQDDLGAFVDFARSSASSSPVVIFNSPGGNPTKAMELGRMIRLLRLPTVQVRGLECSSACTLAFVGGVTRIAEPGSIGVHKTSFSGDIGLNVDDAVSFIQEHTAETIGYLSEMGVDPGLLQLSLRYERDDMRYLSRSEMEQYRVTTAAEAVTSPSDAATATPPSGPTKALPDYRIAAADGRFNIPVAQTGTLRVPKGSEYLRADESQSSAKILLLTNGQSLEIVGVRERWYQVRVGKTLGYVHHNWVRVDQFLQNPFEDRFIQVASFDNFAEAEAYARAAKLPLAVYLASNRWFAVALDRTAPPAQAKALLDQLKSQGAVPADAFMTVGNTYVRKVCCGL